jgi:quinol monooxygenase YgiN
MAGQRYSFLMNIPRREFVALAGVAALAPVERSLAAALESIGGGPMYGVIGKMNATPGQRDALAAVLLEGTGSMPGCLSYVIAADPADPDGLWITEVWDSQASHQASLTLPSVKTAIAKGRPLIAGFSNRVETVPLGGQGLPRAGTR